MHRGFVYAGAMLVKYWAMHFARTGDAETLAWAQAMTDKWRALQHPKTGLLPHFIGAIRADDPEQSPTPYAHVNDARTGAVFMQAADYLKQRPAGRRLARQLRDLGLRTIKGVARHGYDAERRIFPLWLKLEGGEYTEQTFYQFRTQADKERAIILTRTHAETRRRTWGRTTTGQGPTVADVDVFAGPGFFVQSPHSVTTGVRLPLDAAEAAALTGDAELIERARLFADEIMAEARTHTAPLNDQGQWLFPATGGYIRAMLALHQATGEAEYLENARELADIQLRMLTGPMPAGTPEWWRLPARDGFLEALLMLEAAQNRPKGPR